MSTERLDPQLVAAFLDGTASPQERDDVLRALAESNDAYAELVEAAAIAAGVDESAPGAEPSEGANSPAAPAKHRSLRWIIGPFLLAAALGGVIVFSRLRSSEGRSAIQLAQATRLTQSTGSGAVARTLGAAWDQPPWSVARGGGTTLAPTSRAFRAGARFAELEVAASASDSTAVRSIAESLGEIVAATDGGGPLAARLDAAARSADLGGRTERADLGLLLRSTLNSSAWFDLGIWAETARLASMTSDSAFFRPNSAAMVEARRISRAEVPVAERATWATAIDPLRSLVESGSTGGPDLTALDRAIRDIIRIAAR